MSSIFSWIIPSRLYSKLYPRDDTSVPAACLMCFETFNVSKRPCCNALYCDHCYTKDKKCPNCDKPTKQEKLTGATFTLKVYSEHEECRVCLDPGLKRKCCNNYFCDDCYYKVPNCRSCGERVGQVSDKDKNVVVDRAFLTSLLLGWAITIFVVSTIIMFTAITSSSEVQAPVGLFDYKCYGYFRDCGFRVCIDMDASVASGDSPIPALSSWKKCTVDSVVKLQSQACIFDFQLYDITDKLLGYDVCAESYTQGVFIFEDTFEWWDLTQPSNISRNEMKSALWGEVYNGQASDFCGHGEVYGGKYSLSFAGIRRRYATTQDMELSTGGWLEGEFFFPPIGFDATNPRCKTGFIGLVNVLYSTDQGATWEVFYTFDPSRDRQNTFFHFQLNIPDEAKTATTRFMFDQPTFEAASDVWALDNVKVHKYLPDGWRAREGFQNSLREGKEGLQKAQCCSDTDWCDHRLPESTIDDTCEDDFEWYKEPIYLMRLFEAILCMTFFLNVVKFIYVSTQTYLMYQKIPFEEEILEAANIKWVNKYIPPRLQPRNLNNVLTSEAYTSEIHQSARLEESMRNEFGDPEGSGERVRRQEEIDKEKRKADRKVRRAKMKLEARLKGINLSASNFDISKLDPGLQEAAMQMLDMENSTEADEEGKVVDANAVGIQQEQLTDIQQAMMAPIGGDEAVTSDAEKNRRQDTAMLRLPFTIEVDEKLRRNLIIIAITMFLAFFVWQAVLTKSFTINQDVSLFGSIPSSLYVTSGGLFLFAMYCDGKEVYGFLKNLILCRDNWVPQVTIDMTDDQRALFIGNKCIKLNDILEFHAVSVWYMRGITVLYLIGIFPWCLFAMVLREQYMNYSQMRIITPCLGSMMIARAVLGPEILVKALFACKFLFDPHFKIREQIGVSFQSEKSKYSAYTTGFTVFLVALVLTAMLALDWLWLVVPVSLVSGGIYGSFTGCVHSLPIKPWIYVTTLKEGIWMRVRKSQRCPCVYWGNFCTDMHTYDEVFVVHTTDEVKFNTIMKGGLLAGLGVK